MKLYIDPGTGSMLFAVLIGIIGAVAYVFKEWAVKLKFLLTGGKKADTNTEKIPIVIFLMTKDIGACSNQYAKK